METAAKDTVTGFGDVVAELKASLDGEVIAADDTGYEAAAKVWNGMYDERRPVAVLRPTGEEDVRRAVAMLADVDAPLAIRGGGHHIAGFGGCDGGFVIDLSAMRGASVDPEARRIRVEGGALLHDLDTAGAEHGLSVPVGVVSPTGVAGLTLTGGVGWQTRKRGYACDNLRRARVVTAAGEIARASEDENPDLLWALRGGGGNFGVCTELEFEAYPQDEVLVTMAYYAVEDAEGIAALVRAYRDWSLESSNDQTAWIFLGTASETFRALAPRAGRPQVRRPHRLLARRLRRRAGAPRADRELRRLPGRRPDRADADGRAAAPRRQRRRGARRHAALHEGRDDAGADRRDDRRHRLARGRDADQADDLRDGDAGRRDGRRRRDGDGGRDARRGRTSAAGR